MDRIEMEGATVEEAVEAALREMGRSRDDVEIEVVEEGRRGVLGFGKKPAKVVVKLREGGVLPPDAVERASKFLIEVIRRMGMDVEVQARQVGNELYLEVDQGAGGILIGRHGTTLAALSYLMERIVSHSEDVSVKVFVDVAGYLERRRRTLVGLARETADKVRESGQEVELAAMTAFERKVIHTTLHGDSGVRTFSRGEGEERRVVIVPANSPVGAEERDGGGGERRGGRRGRGRGGEQWDRHDSGRGPEGVRDPGPLDLQGSGDGGGRSDSGYGGRRRRGRRGRRGRGGRQGDGPGGDDAREGGEQQEG